MKCCFSSNCAIRFILILGCLISNTKSWTWDIRCETLSPTQTYCGRTMANIDDDDFYDPEIPFEHIDPRVEWLEAHVGTNGSWTIRSHTIFHTFHQLKHLVVMGDPVIPEDVDNVTLKKELKSGLFAPLSTLKILSLRFWEKIGIHEGWKFPKEIEEISLTTCGLIELDLREYTNLRLLDLSGNLHFTKMPQLSSPRPPLRTLRLMANHEMKFSVEDIVELCELRWLDVDNFNEYEGNNPVALYCECKRVKDYMIALNISGQYAAIYCEYYEGALRRHKIPFDCRNHRADDVGTMIRRHKKICPKERPMTTTMEPEIEPWRPEPHPEPEHVTEPSTPSPSPSTTKLPSIVCPSCPGCFLCVIGWFFFLVTLFSSGAAISIYIVITKRLFFFSTVGRKK